MSAAPDSEYRYDLGEIVTFTPPFTPATTAEEEFEIIRRLPVEGGSVSYVVKSTGDGHERVVEEEELVQAGNVKPH